MQLPFNMSRHEKDLFHICVLIVASYLRYVTIKVEWDLSALQYQLGGSTGGCVDSSMCACEGDSERQKREGKPACASVFPCITEVS